MSFDPISYAMGKQAGGGGGGSSEKELFVLDNSTVDYQKISDAVANKKLPVYYDILNKRVYIYTRTISDVHYFCSTDMYNGDYCFMQVSVDENNSLSSSYGVMLNLVASRRDPIPAGATYVNCSSRGVLYVEERKELNPEGVPAGRVPVANGDSTWSWASPPTNRLLVDLSDFDAEYYAFLMALQSFVGSAVANPDSIVRASESFSNGSFVSNLLMNIRAKDITIVIPIQGEQFFTNISTLTPGAVSLRISTIYPVENNTFDIICDCIIALDGITFTGQAALRSYT